MSNTDHNGVKIELANGDDKDGWHSMDATAVLSAFETTKEGLSPAEAEVRMHKYGTNELKGDGGVHPVKMLLAHMFSSISLILYVAVGLSFLAKDIPSAVVILAVVASNVGIGFWLELHSEKTMEALKKMSSPVVKVCRDGKWDSLESVQLVPGDIITVEEGDGMPADVRFLEAVNLEVDEAILTGESLPVSKIVTPIKEENTALGDRKNMGYSGCVCTHGRGLAVVVGTGMNTEIGKIASSIMNTKKEETPLQKRMKHMAYSLFVIAALLAIPVFGANGWAMSEATTLYAVSTAVAIIPEGLVAVITATLGYGMRQMSKKKVIVRKLDALETLGAITNICSDKTGTLTVGKMAAQKIYFSGNEKEYTVDRGLKVDDQPLVTEYRDFPEYCQQALLSAALCNNASVEIMENGEMAVTGDQTEVAMAVMCNGAGVRKSALLNASAFTFVTEFPFDSAVKLMSYICKDKDGKAIMYTKGATEVMIEKCCSRLASPTGLEPLTGELKDKLQKRMVHMADKGLRVLAVGFKYLKEEEVQDILKAEVKTSRAQHEKDIVFLGMVGIMDPPRESTLPSILKCQRAGITVHMATGDHPLTAAAIAKMVKIIPEVNVPEHLVMHATDFDLMSEEEIDKLPSLPLVLARCSPQTKVNLVKALHRRGLLCAMTGDGVNDAPALKTADVGIAMGKTGSDVTKQVAELVLTDDNFASIVVAIEEGRRIFDNLRKFAIHLMTGNVAECVLLIIGLMWRSADDHASLFPMSPIHILWLNMVTSTPPALGLGMEVADKNIMRHPPRGRKEGLFITEVIVDIFVYGLIIGLISFGNYSFVLRHAPDGTPGNEYIPHQCNEHYIGDICLDLYRARGTAFATICFLLLLHAYNCRSLRQPIDLSSLTSNKWLYYSCLIGVVTVVPTFYIPVVNTEVFKHIGLTWQWGLIIAGIVIFQALVELYKFGKRRYYGTPMDTEDIMANKL